MGAGVFHGRVRDGNGCGNPAMATGPPGRILVVLHHRWWGGEGDVMCGVCCAVWCCARRGYAPRGSGEVVWSIVRVIRTARLRSLPALHLRPIDVVVFHGPFGEVSS